MLAVVAVAAMLRWRPPGAAALLLPVAAGWAVATWVALTMHGFWWPGRQVVVVLPLALVAVLWWLAGQGSRVRLVGAALAAVGIAGYAALLVDGRAGELTWVIGFEQVDDPVHQALADLLPDYRSDGAGLWLRHAGALVVLAVLAAVGWRSAGSTSATSDETTGETTEETREQASPTP